MKQLIVIPVYNEEKNIGSVVVSIKKSQPDVDILVIDDGSSDNTFAALQLMPRVKAVRLPFNLGIGAAVQTGLLYSREYGYDIVIRLDGDGQHNPEEIEKLLIPVLKNQADMVIGSRFLNQQKSYPSIIRRIGQKVIAFLISLVTGQKITDSTSGFRVYNKKVIELLCLYYPLDYPEPEEILFLKKNHFAIKESNISIINREEGKSSITALKSIYYIIKIILIIFIGLFSAPTITKKKS